jgi:hypothetical protein
MPARGSIEEEEGTISTGDTFTRKNYRGRVLTGAIFSGANPTIASYNASVVNFYNASDSLARFGKQNNFLLL